MNNVREIIKESCCRVNITPRRQAVPGDIMENAYRLLKGIVAKYNSDNLLAWTQNSIILQNHELIHIFDESDVLKGEFNKYFNTLDELNSYPLTEEDYDNNVWAIVKGQDGYWAPLPHSGSYLWSYYTNVENNQRYQEMRRYESMEHIQVRDVAKIDSLYLISNTNQPYREHYKLEFASHSDFDKYINTANVFTYTQKSEGEWLIQLKPNVAKQNYRIKLNYNEAMEFDLDSDLYIPDNYVELLIVALAHKLALQYPRLDDAQMARLEKEVQVLVDNVRTPKASDRILQRDDYFGVDGNMSQSELMSGYWLY